MLVLRWVLGVVRGSSFAAFLSSLMVIYVIMFWSLIGFWLTFLGKKKLRVLFLIYFGFLGSKNFVILTIWIWSFLEFNWICVIYFYFLKKRNEDLSTGGFLQVGYWYFSCILEFQVVLVILVCFLEGLPILLVLSIFFNE